MEHNQSQVITPSSRKKPKKSFWNLKLFSKRVIYLISFIIILLIGIRLVLPHYVLKYVNKVINQNPGYSGKVNDIELSLWRGAYQIWGISFYKKFAKIPAPLFISPHVDLSVEWRSIFDGSFVGEVEVDSPKVNFVGGPTEKESQDGTEADWLETIRDLFPLKINHFVVNNGQVHYKDFSTKPQVDVYFAKVQAIATNLTNSLDLSKTRVAHIDASGVAQNIAKTNLAMDLDPFSDDPDFYLNGSLKNLPITSLNNFLGAYASVDAEKGDFSAYTELAAQKKVFDGYFKVLIKDLQLLSLEDTHKPLRFIWESIVAFISEIFTNHSQDQIATKIPLTGKYDDPKIGKWKAAIGIFKNAFIEALKPGIDKSIFTVSTKNQSN